MLMKNLYLTLISLLIFAAAAADAFAQTTIDQKLIVVRNDDYTGGEFHVAVQLKGTNLTAANTLGSLTIDIEYDHNLLQFQASDAWAYGSSNGYNRFVSYNTSSIPWFVRVGTTGMGVNADGDGNPAGYDIKNAYETIVVIKFQILNAAEPVSLIIKNITNQVGLFENHSNNPLTAKITNKTLSAPINIESIPLPVELSSFSAASQNSDIVLKWTTATEQNSYGFEVEKAAAGKGIDQKKWTSIGFISARGTSSAAVSYSFTDKSPLPGKYLYRLKEVDNDGKFKYSDEIETALIRPLKFELEQNYPNPFNPSTTIRFSLEKPSQTIISVYNTIGEKVAVLNDSYMDAGFYTVSFDASSLQSGIYFYELQAGNFRQIKKMMLIK